MTLLYLVLVLWKNKISFVAMRILVKLLFSILVILQSCMPTRMIKPLKKGEKSIGAHFGGPMINFAEHQSQFLSPL